MPEGLPPETMKHLLIFGILVAFGALRLGLHYLDISRIQSQAYKMGWTHVRVSWEPFAPGWFWEKNERHYLVHYIDEHGDNKRQYCKTSLMTGIYWKNAS